MEGGDATEYDDPKELHPIACYHGSLVSFMDTSDRENMRHFFDRDAQWHAGRIAVLDNTHEWFATHSQLLMESLYWVEACDAETEA